MKAIGNIILFMLYISLMLISLIGIPILIVHLLLISVDTKSRLKKAKQKLYDSLMDDESVIVDSNETRPYSLFSRRSLIAITRSRIIYFKRPLLGGFQMIDIQWKDLIDAELAQNIIPTLCGSRISFKHSITKDNIDINIPCEPARKIYKYAQKEEQAWEEKRRIRAIEETRAAAGGTYITSPSTITTDSGVSMLDEIKKAKDMLDEGIISDAEFNELKSKILNKGKSI